MKLSSRNIFRTKLILICSIWSCLLIIYHFWFAKAEILLLDNSHKIDLYSDKSEGGISEIGLLSESDTIGYWVELKEFEDSLSWTWASMNIRFDTFIDVSSYDYVEFDIKDSKENILLFEVAVNYPDSTSLPFHSLSQKAQVFREYSHVILPMSDFKTSSWWLSAKDIKEVMSEDVNYNQLMSFSICEGKYTEAFEKEVVFIHSLKFTKTLKWPYYVFFLVLLLVVIIYGLNRLKYSRKTNVTIEYETTPETIDDPELSVLDYIRQNIYNKDLTLKSISVALGMSESKVAQLIKKETFLTFSEFRNMIRIENAKSLLLSTNHSVAEIADQVGYDNVTSFNRMFKKETNQTPTYFRSNN